MYEKRPLEEKFKIFNKTEITYWNNFSDDVLGNANVLQQQQAAPQNNFGNTIGM